mmetsp:Transcript_38954/g.103529  ORF Transcript_38954/g.103529 Transcript_38954/m.103529 type:complete len:334 (+) Transcript_38954:677-1678(+)
MARRPGSTQGGLGGLGVHGRGQRDCGPMQLTDHRVLRGDWPAGPRELVHLGCAQEVRRQLPWTLRARESYEHDHDVVRRRAVVHVVHCGVAVRQRCAPRIRQQLQFQLQGDHRSRHFGGRGHFSGNTSVGPARDTSRWRASRHHPVGRLRVDRSDGAVGIRHHWSVRVGLPRPRWYLGCLQHHLRTSPGDVQHFAPSDSDCVRDPRVVSGGCACLLAHLLGPGEFRHDVGRCGDHPGTRFHDVLLPRNCAGRAQLRHVACGICATRVVRRRLCRSAASSSERCGAREMARWVVPSPLGSQTPHSVIRHIPSLVFLRVIDAQSHVMGNAVRHTF